MIKLGLNLRSSQNIVILNKLSRSYQSRMKIFETWKN